MSRYIYDLTLNKPEGFVSFIMEDYLKKNGFELSAWKKTEDAYRAGDRVLEGYKFLKWSYANGVLHLEAWLKGAFGGEMGLTGFVAALQKAPYRKSLEQLYEILQQEIPESGDGSAPATQAIPVQTVDNSGFATQGLVLGILSVVAAFFIPLLGIILAAIGIGRARMGSGSGKAGMAKAAWRLCIVGACISVGMWVLNFVITMEYIF